MIFRETKLQGVFIVELERLEDSRGFFALCWSERDFTAHGLNPKLVECNLAFNQRKGTLRGMHYQVAPHAQAKLVRCTNGAIYDVAVDLRPQSETFKQWVAVELTADNHRMIYVPEGFAHGYQSLIDNSEVIYQMSAPYAPAAARGVRWNDPAFAIDWPPGEPILIDRDCEYPDFDS